MHSFFLGSSTCLRVLPRSFLLPSRRPLLFGTEDMFVAPASKGFKPSTGRQWKAGERLWDLHLPGPKLLTRNLAAVVHSEAGASNAGTLGLHKPLVVLDATAFADEFLQVQRTELLNRPAIGLSMLAGSLAGLKKNMEEGAAAGIFDKPFVKEFLTLCAKHDVDKINHVLNVQAGWCSLVFYGFGYSVGFFFNAVDSRGLFLGQGLGLIWVSATALCCGAGLPGRGALGRGCPLCGEGDLQAGEQDPGGLAALQ